MKHLFTLIIALPLFVSAQEFSLQTDSLDYDTLVDATLFSTDQLPWDDLNAEDPIALNPPFRMGNRSYPFAQIRAGHVLLTDSAKNFHNFFIMDAIFIRILDRGKGTIIKESPIRFKLTGTYPDRILSVEWRNFGFFGEWYHRNTTQDHGNIVMHFNEKQQEVVVHYGPSEINWPGLSYEGYPGATIYIGEGDMDFNFKGTTLSGNPSNPNVHPGEIDTFIIGIPNQGIRYTFKVGEELANISNTEKLYRVSVYPNPAKDRLFIRSEESITNYSIYGTDGRLLENGNLNSETAIATDHLSSGMYVLELTHHDGVSRTRFMKQ